MSAYATAELGRQPLHCPLGPSDDVSAVLRRRSDTLKAWSGSSFGLDVGLDALIGHIAERIAAAVAAQLATARPDDPNEWLDSRGAAEYLGVHRDTLRKLAAERAIPTEQDGRGCKLFFRRGDLDEWRRGGGRTAHLSAVLDRAA